MLFKWYKRIVSMKLKERLFSDLGVIVFGTLLVLPIWVNQNFGHLDFEQILFLLLSDGQGSTVDWSTIGKFFLFFIPVWSVMGLILFIIKRKQIKINYRSNRLKWAVVIVSVAMIIAYDQQFKVSSFFINGSDDSDMYEKYYVNPNDVDLTFPEEKRNLIYIVLESVETNFSDMTLKSGESVNLIPNLKRLANDHISFSNTDGFGGSKMIRGASWTAASLVGQSSGIPIQITKMDVSFGEEKGFLPGVVSLGDVLEDAGYTNYFLAGSDANFGGRETYYRTHGNYEILDIKHYKEQGILEADYSVFWGFEDAKLFEYAKQEILTISEKEEPFNFTMLTVDTHFTDGYTDLSCDFYYEEAYANAIHCSDSKVYEFVKWIQAQDFYENTTIVISGDHQTMNQDFALGMNDQETRTIYNAFINANFESYDLSRLIYREFSVLDLFPTTLSAMGVDIEGDRLGLGVNLVSNELTLIERLTMDGLDEEIAKNSDFYNSNFLQLEPSE